MGRLARFIRYFTDEDEQQIPAKPVSSIEAVFTQGSAVIYDTDSLNVLKQYLVVTATYEDSTTGIVTNYILSGTLEEGTSTISVYYKGKADTFDVTVTHKEVELVSIDAVFTQGSTVVYDNDSLDSLKTMLVVTAYYDDGTSETVPSTDYTLSGTLTVGTSTITVTYSGKTDTFTVAVTEHGSTEVLKTVTGSILHVLDAIATPMYELVAKLVPKQAGSGDPSPSNVRSISGWTGANIYHSGADTSVYTTIPVTFTDPSTGDPIPFYGGTLTLNEDGSVDLSVDDYGVVNFDSSTTVTRKANNYLITINNVEYGNAYSYTGNSGFKIGQLYSLETSYCNKVKLLRNKNQLSSDYGIVVTAANSASSVDYYIKSSELSDTSSAQATANSIKSWLVNNQVQFVSKTRNDPTVYHFSNVGELQMFLGENNVWVDASDDLTMQYWALED